MRRQNVLSLGQNLPNIIKLMFILLLATAVTTSLFIPTAVTHGDGGDQNLANIPKKPELDYPNLGSHLNELVAMTESGLFSAQEAAADSPIHSGGSVAVTVYLSSNVADVVQFLEDNGGDPRNVGEDYIEAYVPVSLLGELSEQPGVTRVQEIIPPEPAYGNFVSQGVQTHLSQPWNDAGFSGQGVKVGVIDVGFDGLTSLMGSELPTNVQGRCYTDIGEFSNDLSDCDVVDEISPRTPPECVEAALRRAPEGSVHGTAVSEAVIDIAPEVTLYVANPFSRADMQDVVEWMASEGVSVINYSASYIFDGPGDGTSPSTVSPLNTVDQAVASDILFVTSAGNSADNTWFGDYSDPDGDGAISFGGQNVEINDLPFFECRSYIVQLRWEDSWEGASTDLDLYLFHKPTGQLTTIYSVDEQSGESGQIPWEAIGFTALADNEDDFGLVVIHEGGPVPDWIQLLYWGPGEIEHHTISGSIGNPAESANPGMLAVGATHYWDTHTIADYSSQGPTPDGRVKPEIVGTACGETTSYPVRPPEFYDGNNCWFAGTSQASPHVAGMAALVRQRFPEFSAEQAADYLKDNAEQREAPHPNNTWGYGFAVLPSIEGAADTECSQELTGDGTVPGSWAPGCESAVAERGHAKYYTFDLAEESAVTITLESTAADTYLYLREGESQAGTFLYENDDDGGTTKSTIQASLTAGKYTIEATTYEPNETGAFTLTISGLGGTAAPTAGGCSQAITADGPVSGTWAAGCDSGVSARGHARYYTFDLAEESAVTITLESTDADTYLYLREGESRSGTFLHENDDDGGITKSTIAQTLSAGTYTIEATTYGTGETGAFTLTISGLGGTAAPTAGGCSQAITADGPVSGTWAAGCESAVSARGYARYYTFEVAEESAVTITLESADADTYLYLRQGESRSGTFLHENDDDGGITKSTIQGTLSAGPYTIEATTYGTGETGAFTLTISGLGGTAAPTAGGCSQAITADGPVSGTWAAGCDSSVSARGHARYYTFEVAEESAVTITLESTEADTYLYLREGESRSGTFLHENDDDGGITKSTIQETLSAGTFTIEATTYGTGETGSFTLMVSGLDGTAAPGTGDCGQAIAADSTVSGTWAAGCDSAVSARGYARYYTFNLAEESAVTITLESSDADTYLNLWSGSDRTGTPHAFDDDSPDTSRSQIQETLAAGAYTIEATTYSAGETGSFALTVSGLGGSTTPGAGFF